LPNEVDSAKHNLRTLYKQKRSQLSSQQIQEKSQQINQNFLYNLLPNILEKNSNAIFSLYISDGREVLTNLIATHFINNKINFSYPKIIRQHHHLEFILSEPNQAFLANKIYPKILEPTIGKKVFPDILILPLLAFDSNLTRLGMGGGFFDRTIHFLKSNKKIITIGLAYDCQSSASILPYTKTDSALDFIVLETSIISAKPASV